MACQNQKDNSDVYSDALSKRAVAAQKSIDILRQAELDRNEFESSSKFQWDDQKGTYVPYVDPDCSELDVLIDAAVRSMGQSIGQTMREVMLTAIEEYEAKNKIDLVQVLEREERVRTAVTQAIDGMKGHAIYTGYYDVIRVAVIAGILASQGTTDGA